MTNSLAYETNGEGQVLNGSYKNLLESINNCSDLKLGLESKNYEEILPLISVAYTENYIIGIQPYHKASETLHSFIEGENSSFRPYSAIFLYSTEMVVGVFRYKLDGSFRTSRFGALDYNYYKWFVNDDKWQVVYDSAKDYNDTLKKDNLIAVLKNKASDLKLSFSYKGITYIVTPNIIYFPKTSHHAGLSLPITRLSVKTYPILLFENEGPVTNWTKFEIAELLITDSGEISALSYRRFNLPNKSVNKLRRILSRISRIFNKKEKITQLKFQDEVKWFIKH
jgi:hypothetical protein